MYDLLSRNSSLIIIICYFIPFYCIFYSIPIAEKWVPIEYTDNGVERKFPYCDYYIYPMSKWNFGLVSKDFSVTETPYDIPFSPSNPPISLKANVAEIKWGFNNGHCDPCPDNFKKPIGPTQQIDMIPYGCTNLRITEIPFVNTNSAPIIL